MNLTGEVHLDIAGERLTLVYDWRALSRIRSELGPKAVTIALDGDLDSLSKLIEAGLAKHHPDWTADRVMEASPPMNPTVEAVTEALHCAYWGTKEPPEDDGQNPPERKATLSSRLWQRLTGRGSRLPSSGD